MLEAWFQKLEVSISSKIATMTLSTATAARIIPITRLTTAAPLTLMTFKIGPAASINRKATATTDKELNKSRPTDRERIPCLTKHLRFWSKR